MIVGPLAVKKWTITALQNWVGVLFLIFNLNPDHHKTQNVGKVWILEKGRKGHALFNSSTISLKVLPSLIFSSFLPIHFLCFSPSNFLKNCSSMVAAYVCFEAAATKFCFTRENYFLPSKRSLIRVIADFSFFFFSYVFSR